MHQIDYSLIGKRIKESRQLQSISQSLLAEMTSLSTTYISNIETACKHVSLSALFSIADALDITVSDLLYGNQPASPTDYQTDFDLLMESCSPTERRFIFELVRAVVQIIHSSSWLSSEWEYHSTGKAG